jgi:hypothetical protein
MGDYYFNDTCIRWPYRNGWDPSMRRTVKRIVVEQGGPSVKGKRGNTGVSCIQAGIRLIFSSAHLIQKENADE